MTLRSKNTLVVAMLAAVVTLGGCLSDGSERSESAQPGRLGETEAARAERLARGAAAANVLAERVRATGVAESALQNGSFEAWSDKPPMLPAGWQAVEEEATAKTSRVDTPVFDGSTAVRIVSDRGVVSIVSEGLVVSDTQNAGLRGTLVTAGVWARADTPTAAFINIRDGIDESPVVDHPGDGTWQFLAVAHVPSPGATRVSVRIGNRKQDEQSVAIFDGAVLVAPAP